ncbi:argonaute-like protein [Mycena olivaceomarginata]|nr:argonaute-like protein [Mycena olivaceomarginata]
MPRRLRPYQRTTAPPSPPSYAPNTFRCPSHLIPLRAAAPGLCHDALSRRRGGRGGAPALQRGRRATARSGAAHITTMGVRRPDYGSSGRPIDIPSQFFRSGDPGRTIYHYDGACAFLLQRESLFSELIPLIVMQSIFPNTRCVFDGRKNLYAPIELALGGDSCEFDVTLPGAPASSDRPPKIYKIRLALVATVNTEFLHRFIQGQQSHDNTVSTALMALNVVIRMEPSQRFPVKGRSFFSSEGSKSIGADLVLWRGYFQIIRPAVGRMLINVDISTGVMYQPGPLINLCLSFLGQNDPLVLSRNLEDRRRIKLARFLAGIRVETRDASRNPGSGTALTQQGASDVTFVMREGRTMTVARYFQDTTSQPLKFPGLLCVEVGQGAIIPLELCSVWPRQLVKKEIPEKKADLVAFATKSPNHRLASIGKGMEVLAYGQSEYVRKFGLRVNPTVMSTKARVLTAPTLKYGAGSFCVSDPFFSSREMGAGICVSQLLRAGDICATEKKVSPTLFAVILPEGGKDIYTIVKHWGDVTRGVATQCLKARNCTRVNMQFSANVALKINVKLGGINVIPASHHSIRPTQPLVMGADVRVSIRSPARTNGRPSYAVVVSSVDSNAAKYVASKSVQASRHELISDLKRMCIQTLTKYMSYREAVEKVPLSLKAPKCLIFYRTCVSGVSEGQFQQVLDLVPPILNLTVFPAACKELKINPQITLVIVGKRASHEIRLFPVNDRDADRSGNCSAGTVADRDIGHPNESDFYLKSHSGLLGTSRPGYYSVHDLDSFFGLFNINASTAHLYPRLGFVVTTMYESSSGRISKEKDNFFSQVLKKHNPSQIIAESSQIGGMS